MMAEFPFYGTLDNFAVNPSLEASSYDWFTYSWSGTGDRVRGVGAHGDYFYRLTAPSAMSGAKGRYHDVRCPVKAGEKWTASIYVRPSVYMEMQAQGEFRTGSGVVGAVAQAGPITPCPAGEWTRISITMTAEGDATYVRHQTYMRGATLPAGETIDLDAEMVSRGDLADFVDNPQLSGVTEVGASTEARLGIVSDIYSRSREKINLELAGVDKQLIGGQRVELAAAAMTASDAVWHWRQITGPEVELEPRENCLDFIAPDVDEPTSLRIAVYAASEDGRNRSDWRYFDLTIQPSMLRVRGEDDADFSPATPLYVGYDRGKREIWNDVIPPTGFTGRKEPEILDLGIPVEDVEFSEEPPEACVAGGVYVNPVTGDIFRNFGAGYNETDDTTAAPRRRTYWVNPATGDISKWIEDEYVG